MKRKLLVAGCSLSDFTKVAKVYGQYLAEMLDYEYIHEGAGCGSNFRIWRRVTDHIINGTITPNDLVLIQYTERSRREFWTSVPHENIDWPSTLEHTSIIERFRDGGTLIRYKMGAGDWYPTKPIIENLFKTYENHFVSSAYERDVFRVHNFMFQHMLVSNNINAFFIQSHRLAIEAADLFKLPHFAKTAFTEPVTPDKLRMYDLSVGDVGHMNQLGHQVFAEWLYDHIKKQSICTSTP